MEFVIALLIALGAFTGLSESEKAQKIADISSHLTAVANGNGHDDNGGGHALLCPKCFGGTVPPGNEASNRKYLHKNGSFTTISAAH